MSPDVVVFLSTLLLLVVATVAISKNHLEEEEPMKLKTIPELTPERFRTWLETNGDQVEMVANHTARCPIACYLKDILQQEHVDVFGSIIKTDGAIYHVSSTWVEAFVHILDTDNVNCQPIIGKAEALDTLTYVMQRVPNSEA